MIHRTVRQFRVGGCAGRMAEEFGGHPDSAARRMRQLARRPGLGMSRWPEDNGWQSAGKLPGRQRNKGIAMPWFPGFINAAELARRQTRAACQADPVARYITALNKGDIPVLENVRPGEMVVYDTRAGEIRGHKQLRRFVSQNQSWLAGRHARIETVASTCAGGRAVVELLGHLAGDGPELAWPVAVVAESPDDRSVVFRTYCSHWPVDGRRHLRSPIPAPGAARLGDVVGRYQVALNAGDADAIVDTFAPDGYYRKPIGPHPAHRGTAELRSFFTRCFSAGGGIGLQHCVVTDDGVRCALEFNCLRWGRHDLPPQAGIAVCERGQDGLLAAARVYDDIEAPIGSGYAGRAYQLLLGSPRGGRSHRADREIPASPVR